MWDKAGIGLFILVTTAAITLAIVGLSSFMERLYKRKDK